MHPLCEDKEESEKSLFVPVPVKKQTFLEPRQCSRLRVPMNPTLQSSNLNHLRVHLISMMRLWEAFYFMLKEPRKGDFASSNCVDCLSNDVCKEYWSFSKSLQRIPTFLQLSSNEEKILPIMDRDLEMKELEETEANEMDEETTEKTSEVVEENVVVTKKRSREEPDLDDARMESSVTIQDLNDLFADSSAEPIEQAPPKKKRRLDKEAAPRNSTSEKKQKSGKGKDFAKITAQQKKKKGGKGPMGNQKRSLQEVYASDNEEDSDDEFLSVEPPTKKIRILTGGSNFIDLTGDWKTPEDNDIPMTMEDEHADRQGAMVPMFFDEMNFWKRGKTNKSSSRFRRWLKELNSSRPVGCVAVHICSIANFDESAQEEMSGLHRTLNDFAEFNQVPLTFQEKTFCYLVLIHIMIPGGSTRLKNPTYQRKLGDVLTGKDGKRLVYSFVVSDEDDDKIRQVCGVKKKTKNQKK